MIRGTTTSFIFTVPNTINPQDITYVAATFWQNGNKGTDIVPLPMIKYYSGMQGDEGTQISPIPFSSTNPHEIIITLTAAETAVFSDKLKARAQAKIVVGDRSYGTEEQIITVYPMHDGMIGGDLDIGTPTGSDWIILDGKSIG